MNWIITETKRPEPGEPVLGYHPEWEDPDFNPKGVSECHWVESYLGDSAVYGWYRAVWNNDQDCWRTEETYAPMFWMPLPDPPVYEAPIKIVE